MLNYKFVPVKADSGVSQAGSGKEPGGSWMIT
jgi:hypothetical protein